MLVAASPANAEWQLDVSLAGSGGGSVEFSAPTGQNGMCPPTCTYGAASTTIGTLMPSAAPGSSFSGWSGCTSVTGDTCTVTLTSAPDSCCPPTPHTALYAVSATFGPAPVKRPQEGYCIPTVERGWTFVQLEVDQFVRDPHWAAILAGLPVVLDGHRITPTGAPAILAGLVPGVGLTCDQPYVPYPPGSPFGRRPLLASS